ncbi:MAG: polysaccharide biosynthesis protein [Bacilli bacterium]|nr:polysaccharide biosynthesis protein [Bacilli bacterium]
MKKRVLFVSSTGGHLNELMQLKNMFNDYDFYIVTERMKTNNYLKEKYKSKVSYLLYGTKDHMLTYPFVLLANCFICLFIYLKFHPDYIVTTGAHVGGVMALIGKIFGSRVVYIETFANITTKTITGKLVYKFADIFIVQWESMLELYPNATYGGWIF